VVTNRRLKASCEARAADDTVARWAASPQVRNRRGMDMARLWGEKEPDSGLPRLAFKIRTGGVAWLKTRLAAEKMLPSTRIGQTIHLFARRALSAAAAIPRGLRRSLAAEYPHAHEILFAFYDLQVAPVTFDFLWFLAAADLQRRHLGLKSVHVVIVPGSLHGLRRERDDYDLVVDTAARQARIQNILIQACRVLPSFGGLTVTTSRQEAEFLRSVVARHMLPVDYEPALPVYPGPQSCLEAARRGESGIACLRAPIEELRAVDAWVKAHAGSRRLIVITLRRYGYMPARNSNLPAWIAFAQALDASRYCPVFVPDTSDTIQGMPTELRDFTVFPEAAWNIALRMALYERAFLNLGVNNGPMGLAWLNARVCYATLKIETADVPQSSLGFIRSFGFEAGKSLPFATSLQEWVWEDDTQEAITRAFERLTERIETVSDKARPSG
jgi:hypothetical protein